MLQALLSGGLGGAPDLGGGLPPDLGGPDLGGPDLGGGPPDSTQPMSAVDHIREAMKHLMMAMTQTEDDQQGHGISKGMATLQGLLAGDAKQRLAAGGGG
jgi:mono/diheme cytochrome c family protein